MQTWNRCGWLGLLLLGGLVVPAFGQADNPATVTYQAVKFAGVEDAVKANKGKVVVVDFWADYCVPCKKSFPHLVELSEKYGKAGLAVVAVNLDDPTDKEARERSIKFLKDKKATFTNLFVAEGEMPESWFKKLQIEAIPAVFVFGRDGNLEKRFVDEMVDHAVVEKLVQQLLKK
jgi:thiol-disulfide isomerase/thioredoxin